MSIREKELLEKTDFAEKKGEKGIDL